MKLNRTPSLSAVLGFDRTSIPLIVVRLPPFILMLLPWLTTPWTRGLSTPTFHSFSFSFLPMTILLTWPAPNMESLGGEPLIDVAAVGDRRRWVREPLIPERRTELDRLTALRILIASSLSPLLWFS